MMEEQTGLSAQYFLAAVADFVAIKGQADWKDLQVRPDLEVNQFATGGQSWSRVTALMEPMEVLVASLIVVESGIRLFVTREAIDWPVG